MSPISLKTLTTIQLIHLWTGFIPLLWDSYHPQSDPQNASSLLYSAEWKVGGGWRSFVFCFVVIFVCCYCCLLLLCPKNPNISQLLLGFDKYCLPVQMTALVFRATLPLFWVTEFLFIHSISCSTRFVSIFAYKHFN